MYVVCAYLCVAWLLCSRIIGKGVFFCAGWLLGKALGPALAEVEVLSEAKEVFHSVHSQFPNAYIMTSYSIHDHFQ